MRPRSTFHAVSAIIVTFLSAGLSVVAEDQKPQDQRAALEARVKEVLQEDNVSRRGHIDVVFELADQYANEGNDPEAIRLYQEALQVDSWRLDAQLKLARLLHKHGDVTQAIDKAKTVAQYAEDDESIREAEQLLTECGVGAVTESGAGLSAATSQTEIVLVPIGRVNRRLLNEVRTTLQAKLGIAYSISETVLDPGTVDRSYADHYVATLVEAIRSSITPEVRKKVQGVDDLLTMDVSTFPGRVSFIERFLEKTGRGEEIADFRKTVKDLEGHGQFDAARLLKILESRYPLGTRPAVKGYLGVTEEDLFYGNNEFVFGWAGKGSGVMSYRRFLAVFHEEPPNRPRLRDRTAKQMISSSFYMLGIPRCTSPTCARAYPHSLTEHDQKSVELCAWCKERLQAVLNPKPLE